MTVYQKLSTPVDSMMLLIPLLVGIPILFFLFLAFTTQTYVSMPVSIILALIIRLVFYRYRIPIFNAQQITTILFLYKYHKQTSMSWFKLVVAYLYIPMLLA